MKWSLSLFFILGTTTLSLSGCMAMGMHGMMQHGSSHQDHPANTPVTAEIRTDAVSIVLEVPPLYAGEESIISVKIYALHSRIPQSGAQVTVLVQQAEHSAAGSAAHTAREMPVRRAEEAAEKGVYQLKYVFAEPGVYKVVAQIQLNGGDQAVPPLAVTATQEVGHRGHGGHPMDISSMVVLGGIGMVLMMAAMMGGGLF